MNNYIVCYDLLKDGADYDPIIKRIQAYYSYARINKSVWAIRTKYSATEVRDQLKSKVNQGDIIFVGKLSGTAAWINVGESDQLKKLLES